MLEKKTLEELKAHMPRGYANRVITKHKALFGLEISRKTVYRFFKGETYTTQLHDTILQVAQEPHELVAKTSKLLGHE